MPVHVRICSIVASAALSLVGALTIVACNKPGPVTPPVTLASISLASTSVVGGNPVQGTATLSAAASSSGATVALSSNVGSATVPPNVVVAAGATTATFTVTTTAVTSSATATIAGSFGETRTATLNVTPIPLAAVFTVTSPSQGNNGCRLNAGGATLDCTFDAGGSIGPIATYAWSYSIGKNTIDVAPSSNNQLPTPSTNSCGLFAGETGGGSATALQMKVTLTVRDATGNSAQSTNNGVSVVPRANTCGF